MRANEEALRATIWNLRRATNIHGDIFVSNANKYYFKAYTYLIEVDSCVGCCVLHVAGGRAYLMLN